MNIIQLVRKYGNYILTKSLILILFVPISISSAQDVVKITADKYNLSVRSQHEYYLTITYKKGNKRETTVLSPGKYWSKKGYYSKSEFRRTEIVCTYTESNYHKDKKALNSKLKVTLNSIEKSRNSANNAAISDLRNKVLADLAAKYNSDSESWYNKLVRIGGRFVKGIYYVKEIIDEINTYHFKSYEDLFKEYLMFKFEDTAVSQASNLVDELIGLENESSEYIIAAILYYLKEVDSNNEKYDKYDEKANDLYNEKVEEIKRLKDDYDFSNKHTYNVFKSVEKPINLRTKSPNFNIFIEPLSYGSSLNNHWHSPSETLLVEKKGSEEFEFSDALWNNTFGAGFSFNIGPELRLSPSSYSRFYLSISYYNTSYPLGTKIKISNHFFDEYPSGSHDFTTKEPFRFNHKRITTDLTWRCFIGRSLFFDFFGGYSLNSGEIDLTQSELTTTGYSWKETKISLSDDNYQPFAGAKLGIGWNMFNKGTHLTCGAHFYKVDHENTSEYLIVDSETDKFIDYGSEGKYIYRINVGLNISF